MEGPEAADARHRSFDPEVAPLDPLLQMLGQVVHRRARQQARTHGEKSPASMWLQFENGWRER
jgi:hypothetical protein